MKGKSVPATLLTTVKPGRKRGRRAPGGRLDRAWLLLTGGKHTTASLARGLRVSPATAFRAIGELRKQGIRI